MGGILGTDDGSVDNHDGPSLELIVGTTLGAIVGSVESDKGLSLDSRFGLVDGCSDNDDGPLLGSFDGSVLGSIVGSIDIDDGIVDGDSRSRYDGIADGLIDVDEVGTINACGGVLGMPLGCSEGSIDRTTVGAKLAFRVNGTTLGSNDGGILELSVGITVGNFDD